MIPARWRMITEDDRAIVSFQCSGDGVDACRAPASWVAERTDDDGQPLAIVTSRCPDHIPVRALQTLMPMPVVTREGIRTAMTKPPLRPGEPPIEEAIGVFSETREAPVAAPETSPGEDELADTQRSRKGAPPLPPSSSVPPVSHDVDDLDEDDV